MSKNVKKIRIILLLFTFVIALFGTEVYAQKNVTDRETMNTLLNALNISLSDRNLTGETKITRAQSAALVLKFMNIEAFSASADSFEDLKKDHPYYDAVETAKAMKIVYGDENGYFRPDDYIQYKHAIVMIERGLGYSDILNSDSNLVNLRTNLDFTNGISGVKDTDYISYDVMRALLYNALDCYVAKQEYSYRGKYTFDTKALEEYFDVYSAKGVVTATNITSLAGYALVGDNYVRIGNEEYKANSENISEYLGQNISFYYKETDEDNVIMFVHGSNSDSVRFKFDEYGVSYSKNVYKVYDENKVREYKLDKNHDLIYNGKIVLENRNNNMYVPSDGNNRLTGEVELIDEDDNGYYDLVLVNAYETVIVGRIDKENKIFVDKLTKKTFNYSDIDDLRVTDTDGYLSDISKIVDNNVLLVSQSIDNKVMIIRISDKLISGKITAISQSDNEFTLIEIDGVAYEVSNVFFDTENSVLKVNDEGTFLLDANQRIVMQTINSAQKQIYFLLSVFVDEDTNDKIHISVLDKENERRNYTLSDKVKIDSKRPGKDNEAVLNVLQKDLNGGKVAKRTVVALEFDADGVVTNIDFPYENGQPGENETNNTLHKYVSHFELTGTDSGLLQWQGETNVLSWRIPVSPNTIIFFVPENINTAKVDEFEAAPLNTKMIANSTWIRADAYTLSYPESVADVLVARSMPPAMKSRGGITLVAKIYEGLNEDDERCTVLELVEGSTRVKKYVSEDYDIGSCGVEKGDVVRYATNTKDEIVQMAVFYDFSENKVERDEYAYASQTNQVHAGDNTIMGGVYDIVNGYIRVFPANITPDRNTEFFYFPMNLGQKIIYNASLKDTEAFDVSKIKTYSLYGEQYSKAVFFLQNGVPKREYYYIED